MASREIFEALGKRNDSIEQLRQEKYKPLQNPIEEEKTEDNLTIENEDNYGGASHTGKKMDGSMYSLVRIRMLYEEEILLALGLEILLITLLRPKE